MALFQKVQVQVEQQDLIEDDNPDHGTIESITQRSMESANQPIIRDSSRNRLQRLGKLYSNSDLSSPIHRTEGQFYTGSSDDVTSPKKVTQRYNKLAALASSINQWEDDLRHISPHQTQSHPQLNVVPPPKPDLPSRHQMNKASSASDVFTKTAKLSDTTKCDSERINRNTTKHLNWDPKVINSLEAQGFQRRESSTVKLAYDYNKDQGSADDEEEETVALLNIPPTSAKPTIKKIAATEGHTQSKNENKPGRITSSVQPGLVSGRAALFEHKAGVKQQQQEEKPQKDPTELSLKERMQLFEKNRGEALLPKAAFGMAPSINKIRQDQLAKKTEATKALNPANPSNSSLGCSTFASVKSNTDSNVRDKVAALVASVTDTISENKIKADIKKQRQEDMQVLANRFHRQKDAVEQSKHPNDDGQGNFDETDRCQQKIKTTIPNVVTTSNKIRPPPPPPPPPQAPAQLSVAEPPTVTNVISSKRRSPGDVIDDNKRARKSNNVSHTATITRSARNRLYPALSDFETNDSLSDNDDEVTASARSAADEERLMKQHEEEQQHNVHEDNDSYMDSDQAEDTSSTGICNGSLGREIMQEVKKKDQQGQRHNKFSYQQQHQQQQQQRPKTVHYASKNEYFEETDEGTADSSLNSSEVSMGIDDYLNEALDENVDDGDDDYTGGEEDDMNNSRISRNSKGTTASNSFSFRKAPGSTYVSCQTINEESDRDCEPVKSELIIDNKEENAVTLVHTVSFYRRQQTANSANSTPVRRISREQQIQRSEIGEATSVALQFETPPSQHTQYAGATPYKPKDVNIEECTNDEENETEMYDDDDSQYKVQEKVKKLLHEVRKQQQVISQTSQALNLCAATVEFSGSTESVEGERHLLVATHRRQACLDEVQRLRVEKSLRPLGAPKERGVLTVKEITLPLRQDYIRKLAADTISGHHLVCLLKYNDNVLATGTVPTLPGLLAVKFPDVLQLNNVYADFKITLEIYGMTAQREVLPHEVKYHINLNKKSGIKTPKKKANDNILVMPPVQSPAGPYAVRTPALVQYAFAIFSLREIQRTSWTLTQTLGVSPLDGVVHMKINCELSVSVEYKGFLTMFEDISGFGAWHRRWCYLNGSVLNYWKYPDDEKKKTPMGSIDLYTCTSYKVGLAPRDICARLNTILLECERPAKDTDQESLVIVPNGRITIVRHLLSADTREERDEWCAYFNKALTLLRAWGPPQ